MQEHVLLAKSAVNNAELDKLMLGEPRYWFTSKDSYAPGPTDVGTLIDSLYLDMQGPDFFQTRSEFIRALWSVVDKFEGIYAASHSIFTETYRRRKGEATFDVPTNDLAARLRATIIRHEVRLKNERSWIGWSCRLDDLRQLSQTTNEHGGPAFCD